MTASSPSPGRTSSVLGWSLTVALAASASVPALAGPGSSRARPGHHPAHPLPRERRSRHDERLDVGITGSSRATLRLGAEEHDAHFQAIDERKAIFEARGTELGFRDAWQDNLAAYHLDRLLGLDMVPVTVERSVRGKRGALTWWIDDVILNEQARVAKKVTPPDPTSWNAQTLILRVFDELIANTDRNQTNLLIDKHWKVWMIDHSRAFRRTPDLKAENLTEDRLQFAPEPWTLTRDEVK